MNLFRSLFQLRWVKRVIIIAAVLVVVYVGFVAMVVGANQFGHTDFSVGITESNPVVATPGSP